MYNNFEKEISYAKRHFAEHKGRWTKMNGLSILDWKHTSGSIDHYIRYVFDEEKGQLYISGDLGHACVQLTEKATLHNLSRYIKMVGYFVEKIRCSTDLYAYDEDVARERLNSVIIDDDEEYLEPEELSERKEFIQDLLDHMSYIDGLVHMSDEQKEKLSEYDSDWWEWISGCGRKVHTRVICWLVGLNMAYEQLHKHISDLHTEDRLWWQGKSYLVTSEPYMAETDSGKEWTVKVSGADNVSVLRARDFEDGCVDLEWRA